MNEDFEFSASYKVSKTFDDASNYDEQPPNPFDLPAERGLSRQDQWQRFVLNALWDLPFGEEEGQKAQQNRGWLTRAFSHIEVAPIFTVGNGRPVNALTGLDSNRTDAFPLSSRPLEFGRNSVQTPAVVTLDLLTPSNTFLSVSRDDWTWSQSRSTFSTARTLRKSIQFLARIRLPWRDSGSRPKHTMLARFRFRLISSFEK